MSEDRSRQRWKLGAKLAVQRAWARTKEVLFTEPNESDGRAAERAEASALAAEAGQLRGGVAKVAQMTAYFRGPVGAESDGARESLSPLWDHLAPMDPARARAVVTDELGPVEDVFPGWQDAPLASASIGQVHRAGDVAVKVQYPEVADALRSDLRSSRLVEDLGGTGRRLEASAVEAVRAAILAELDYHAEADALERAAADYADDDEVRIPAVDRPRSSDRVLTMELLHGQPLADVAATADERLRREVAATLFRFAWLGPLRFGWMNADPNPGNYLVLPGDPPVVGFLDFGCTVTLDDELRRGELALWRAAVHHDAFESANRFRANLVERGLVASARALHGELFRTWERIVTAPFLARGSFHWDTHHADELARTTSLLLADRTLRLPGNLALLWRQRLGVAAVLGSLAAELPFRALLGDGVKQIKFST